MSFRFRRTLSLLPGVRLNVGATGASVSLGPKGAKLTVSPKGLRATAGMPGSGLFYTQQIPFSKTTNSKTEESELELPPEVKKVIQDRPQYWELLLIQRALRSTADEVNSMATIASTYGTDAVTFHQWIQDIITEMQHIVSECDMLNAEMQKALAPVWSGKPGDPDSLLATVDHLIEVTRQAIVCEQRAAALARHPLYGSLAEPLRNIAQPFVDVFNDLLRDLDEQLPNLGVTHEIDLRLTLKAVASVDSFDSAQDAYAHRFFDSNYALRTGDVVKERFRIARGERELGVFSRAAIADNLANNIFQEDDLFWSDDANTWQPLSKLL